MTEELPLPEVVEIKPVNQFADKLYKLVTAPAKEQAWNTPNDNSQWDHIEFERGEKIK